MVDPSYAKSVGSSFGGAWTLQDPTQVPSGNALQAQNVVYTRGGGGLEVGTRLGFSAAFDTADKMSAMYNWVSDIGNFLFWYRNSDNSVQYMDVVNQPGAQVQVIPGNLIGVAATFAPAGARLILSFFTNAAMGARGGIVITAQGGGFVYDPAFQPPISYYPGSPAEFQQFGGGKMTGGRHLFGYLIEYRSGFTTRPSPDSGFGTFPTVDSFVPIDAVIVQDNYVSWNLTTTWPVGAIAIIPIMTTADNLSQWFIPQGLSQAVVGGVSSTITFTISISDQLLKSTGVDVTDFFTIISNSLSGTPQFNPKCVLTHGDRAVWVTDIANSLGKLSGALFVSALGDYQKIDAALSLIQIPGQRQITTCISMDGTLYILGPTYTYQTTDNQSDPSSWATPKLVDGFKGTISVRGVQVSPSGTYAWVACQDGLYFFQGAYEPLPISYNQDTVWNRINWNAAQAVQIKDVPHLRKVLVMVCLDTATTPSHLLTWNYTQGFGPTTGNFSIDFLQGYDLGAMEVVTNSLPLQVTSASQQQELWLGSSSVGLGILRGNQPSDSDPFLDNGEPIFAVYETGLYPPRTGRHGAMGQVLHHHGADYRVIGNGTVLVTARGLDDSFAYPENLITLSTSPGEMPHRGFDVISEGVSHLFSQGENLVIDGSFEGSTT